MTHAPDHAGSLETAISALLGAPVEARDDDERTADEAEIARLGAELLEEPDAADTIGDVFDAVVGPTLMAARNVPPSSTRVGRASASAWTDITMRPLAVADLAIRAATFWSV